MKHICAVLCAIGSAAAAQTGSPTRAQYEADLKAAMSVIQANTVLQGPEQITMSAQHIPGNTNWVNAGKGVCDPAAAYGKLRACIWNNAGAMNAYTDALRRAGASAIDINFDPLVLSAASQYQPPAAYRIASDCPGGWECGTLANYDALIQHAVSLGLKVKLRPNPDTVAAAARLTASNTLADLENWILPLYAAAAARWGASIDSFTVVHEVVGAFGTGVPFPLTVPAVSTFVRDAAATVKGRNPAIRVGATAETMFSADGAYFYSYLTLGLDYVGVDLYGSSCDVKDYPGTAMATAGIWATAAAKAGVRIEVEEAARPRWLPYACPMPSENFAIEGAGDMDWVQDGADAAWLNAVVPALAAQGYRMFSLFPSAPLIWATTDHANDNMQAGSYARDVMSNLGGLTSTGKAFASAGALVNGNRVNTIVPTRRPLR
ncbi:MAG: hypothetical protein U0Q18_35780 [Bryobacteraceae bacterium]